MYFIFLGKKWLNHYRRRLASGFHKITPYKTRVCFIIATCAFLRDVSIYILHSLLFIHSNSIKRLYLLPKYRSAIAIKPMSFMRETERVSIWTSASSGGSWTRKLLLSEIQLLNGLPFTLHHLYQNTLKWHDNTITVLAQFKYNNG